MPVEYDYPDLPQDNTFATSYDTGRQLPPPPVTVTASKALPPPPTSLIKSEPPPPPVTTTTYSKFDTINSSTKNTTVTCSYNLIVIIFSLLFIAVQICLMIAYGIFIGLNAGNGGLYTLMIFNIVIAAINIAVGIFSIVSNISIIDCLKDCLRPVQYILFVTALIAFCVLGVISVGLNAFIFIYQGLNGMLIMAGVVICVNFAAFIVMIILTSINVGWVRCKLDRR